MPMHSASVGPTRGSSVTIVSLNIVERRKDMIFELNCAVDQHSNR